LRFPLQSASPVFQIVEDDFAEAERQIGDVMAGAECPGGTSR
jgi:hypothetical protein